MNTTAAPRQELTTPLAVRLTAKQLREIDRLAVETTNPRSAALRRVIEAGLKQLQGQRDT